MMAYTKSENASRKKQSKGPKSRSRQATAVPRGRESKSRNTMTIDLRRLQLKAPH